MIQNRQHAKSSQEHSNACQLYIPTKSSNFSNAIHALQ